MTDYLIAMYPWLKAGHIISVISWMAGIFYLPRLFVHHSEKVEVPSQTDRLFFHDGIEIVKGHHDAGYACHLGFWAVFGGDTWSVRLVRHLALG